MRLVGPDQQIYPQATPSGEQGVLLDTHWDIHYPGPARVYLSEADIRDVLSTDDVIDLPLVFELLEARGWTPPARLAEIVADANAELEKAEADRQDAIAEADGLRLSLSRCVAANEAGTEFVQPTSEAAGDEVTV